MSDQDKAIVSALYRAVNEISTDGNSHEKQYLRDVVEKAINEFGTVNYYSDKRFTADKQTYLNQKHPL